MQALGYHVYFPKSPQIRVEVLSPSKLTMIKLYNNESGESLGTLTEEHLKFLSDQLEEESETDTDYYIRKDSLDTFAKEGADPALIDLLRQAMGSNDHVEIRWSRE